MRLAVYYPRYCGGDGGPTLATRAWVKALREAGCGVRVLCAGPVHDPAMGENHVAVPHRSVGAITLPVLPALIRAIRGCDALILHSAWVPHNVLAARAARLCHIPYVLTPHGGYDPHVVRRHRSKKRAWWVIAEARLIAGAAAIHVFFPEEEGYVRNLGFKGRVIAVPHGLIGPTRTSWDGGSGRYLLWLGRYDIEHKGLDVLLEGYVQIPPGERPPLRLHGPDFKGQRVAVERWVQEGRLGGDVTVGGPIHGVEKERALAAAAAFVYPSRWDAHSVAVTEALACGVPVVISDRMPIASMLRDYDAAFVASLSPSDLAQALRDALGKRRSVVAANGRRFVTEVLSWRRCASLYLRELEAVCASGA